MSSINTDVTKCPLNTPVILYCEYMMCKYIFIGTLTINPYDGSITRGECIEGDADIFYRAVIKGWGDIDE